MSNIQENIEAVRKEKGVNQTVLAERLGVTQATYSGYITKNQDLKYQVILDIADKLEVNIIDIITYPDVYVLRKEQCQNCKEQTKTIENLNFLVDTLKREIERLKVKRE